MHNAAYFRPFIPISITASRFSIARILLTKPCDVQLLATRCCPARGSAASAPSSSDTASPTSSFLSSLFVNKQTYLETVPHLYRNAAFFFDRWEETEKFVKTVGHHCLRHIRTVEVFVDDDACCSFHESSIQPTNEWNYTRLFRTIVAYMPNIEHLKIGFWYDSCIRLETDEETGWARRCDQFEKAVLRFSALKRVRVVDVELLFAEGDSWGVEYDSLPTHRGIAKTIRTGDQGALDGVREAVLIEERRDFGEDLVDSFPDLIARSALSKNWWIKKLELS